jgi:hypothetical protein
MIVTLPVLQERLLISQCGSPSMSRSAASAALHHRKREHSPNLMSCMMDARHERHASFELETRDCPGVTR